MQRKRVGGGVWSGLRAGSNCSPYLFGCTQFRLLSRHYSLFAYFITASTWQESVTYERGQKNLASKVFSAKRPLQRFLSVHQSANRFSEHLMYFNYNIMTR